jgi:NADH dehydrogenase
VRTATLVERATDESAVLSTGDLVETRTIVWSAGVRPVDIKTRGVPRVATKQIEVDDRLMLPGREDVFAIGDLVSVQLDGDRLPMLAPIAMQEGRYVARAIVRRVKASPGNLKPFRYMDKGTMATIGRNAAVGQIGRIRFKGLLGWAAWLVVHLYYLVGFRNRLVVLASWTWNYFRKDRPLRIVVRAQEDRIADDS